MKFDFKFMDDALLYYNLRQGKLYEAETSEFFLKRVSKISKCADIGANMGYFTLLFASLAPDGVVYSMEANPDIIDHLKQNVEINGFDNVKVLNQAASSSSGTVDLHYNPNVLAHGSIYSNPNFRVQRSVRAEKLDNVFGSEKMDFVKMDIEGSEPLALEGMKTQLNNCSAPIMIIEFNPEYDMQSLCRSIPDGYNLYLFNDSDITPVKCDYLQQLKSTKNVIVSKSPLEDQI